MKAADLFAAKELIEKFEDQVLEIAPGLDFTSATFDTYDDSFELLDVGNEARFTLEQISQFGGMGFQRCWLNHHDGTETRYLRSEGSGWGFDRVSPGDGAQLLISKWKPLAAHHPEIVAAWEGAALTEQSNL